MRIPNNFLIDEINYTLVANSLITNVNLDALGMLIPHNSDLDFGNSLSFTIKNFK